MKNTIISIISFIVWISLFADYGIGVVHSFKSHGVNDGLIGSVLFPWAMYRGVEFWWHDEYSDVDWENRLSSDMQSCVYFIGVVNEKGVNKYNINEELEKFSKKINDYPLDKKKYLLNGTKTYISYSNSFTNDFLASIIGYQKNGEFNYKQSAATKKLEIELSNFKLNEEIAFNKKEIEKSIKEIKDVFQNDFDNIDYYNAENIENLIRNSTKLRNKEYKRIFRSLFNENL